MKKFWKPGTMVYPLPAVLISCGEDTEHCNIMTAAWTGTVCSEPAMCYVSIRRERFSYPIIERTREFVINLTTRAMAEATDWCGVRSGRDFDKVKFCHLHASAGISINAPSIDESPVSVECKVVDIRPLGSHDMFLAEVTGVLVDAKYIDENTGKFDIAKAELICYSHGEYFNIGECIGSFGWSVKGHTLRNEKRSGKLSKD